jgi:hypothetical protein
MSDDITTETAPVAAPKMWTRDDLWEGGLTITYPLGLVQGTLIVDGVVHAVTRTDVLKVQDALLAELNQSAA